MYIDSAKNNLLLSFVYVYTLQMTYHIAIADEFFDLV